MSFADSDQPTFGIPDKQDEHVPGQVLIRVRPGAIRTQLHQLPMTTAGAREVPESVLEPVEYLRKNAGLRNLRPLFSDRIDRLERADVSGPARAKLAVAASVIDPQEDELAGISIASLPRKANTQRLIKNASSARAIEFIEPVPARWLAASKADPMQNLQWGLRAIKWFEVRSNDAKTVRVDVLDTGIDQKHPDLKQALTHYHHAGLRADDLVGHGTHVAGIIAASANDGVGIAGIARCKLVAWKIFGDRPDEGQFYVDMESYLRALAGASRGGAKVINLSIGGPASSRTEVLVFRRLARDGVTVVAAMGNEYEYGNATSYPAAYKEVISVGSVAETRRRSGFSNTGRHIDVVAPGSNILSTLPTKRSSYRDETEYAAWSGTSMATPHVAAAAALVLRKHPSWSPDQVRRHLRRTAARLPAMRGKRWTATYGAGLIDLQRALRNPR